MRTNGTELWRSDGSLAGTTMVADINTSGSSNPGFPGTFTQLGNTLYFSANDGTTGNELWKLELESEPPQPPEDDELCVPIPLDSGKVVLICI